MRSCKFVVVGTETGGAAAEFRKGVTHWETLTRGARALGGEVVLCSPDPCVLTPWTRVKFSKPVRYSVERLRYNYMLTIDYGGGNRQRLVYPAKVWERVQGVIEPFARGEKVSQQGAVFYGPPGTGKTSIARFIAEMLGVRVIHASPFQIFSKWLGETERNLAKLLAEAESSEPSVLMVNDCEWLFGAREMKAGETSFTVQLSVTNILLERIETWNNEGRSILVLATTNAPVAFLDKALLRSGRLGTPIYVPLPDFEAVYEYLVHEGVSERAAAEWATKAVNLGLSMAEVKMEILDSLRHGREPRLEPKQEHGYKRFIVSFPDDRRLRQLVDAYLGGISAKLGNLGDVARRRMERGQRTVLWVSGPENVAAAVANALLLYWEKLPTVTLTEATHSAVENAIEAANSLRGFLIVPESLVERGAEVLFSSAVNVCYAGESWRAGLRIPVLYKHDRLSPEEEVVAVAAIAFGMYGVDYSFQDLADIGKIAAAKGEKEVLRYIDRAGYYASSTANLRAGLMALAE